MEDCVFSSDKVHDRSIRVSIRCSDGMVQVYCCVAGGKARFVEAAQAPRTYTRPALAELHRRGVCWFCNWGRGSTGSVWCRDTRDGLTKGPLSRTVALADDRGQLGHLSEGCNVSYEALHLACNVGHAPAAAIAVSAASPA